MGESRCPDKLQGWFKRVWKQARRFASMATEIHKPETLTLSVDQENIISVLLARAYPDRIARLRADGDGYTYQLSNGRSAVLPVDDSLAGTEWLAVAELGGKVGEPVDRIYSASELDPVNFGQILSTLVSEQENVEWDYRKERFMAERRTHIGSILLSSDVLEQVSDEARSAALLAVALSQGIC